MRAPAARTLSYSYQDFELATTAFASGVNCVCIVFNSKLVLIHLSQTCFSLACK